MNNNTTKSDRINAKDLINIGIFTVLYAVIVLGVSMLGFIPVLVPLMSVLCPLAGGIPFMLFLTRVKKFGMITLMGLLMGLVMILGGTNFTGPFVGALFGFVADLIMRSGNYTSAKKDIFGYAVFTCMIVNMFLPIIFNREAYVATLIASGYGQEYADTLIRMMPTWLLPVLLVICFVCGLIGGMIGRAVLKKHFVRAGIT